MQCWHGDGFINSSLDCHKYILIDLYFIYCQHKEQRTHSNKNNNMYHARLRYSIKKPIYYYTPAPLEGDILFYLYPSFRLSFRYSVPPKIFFVAFISGTIDGRNLIFCHKLQIGMPYCGKRFWTRQIPTSFLLT